MANRYNITFNTEAEYNTFKASSGYVEPNVSYISGDNIVHYNPYVDPYAGHDYVEIGGLKWATMNIGATGVTDYGLYFQWGDTQGYTIEETGNGEGYKYFGWNTYIYGDGTPSLANTGLSKYNETDTKTVMELSDDAVNNAWGGKWRMPTNDEYQTLVDSTTVVWTNDYEGSGIRGAIYTSKEDSSKKLFFPAGAAQYDYADDNDCHYWSNTIFTTYHEYKEAYYMYVNKTAGTSVVSSCYRYWGGCMRGVLDA